MSLTVTKSEGVTVFSFTSNPKSKWPMICQILGTMCCSPFYFISQSMKQKLGSSHKVLGTLQIMVGAMNVGLGCISANFPIFRNFWNEPFWLGGMFIAVGIVCILAERFPSPCLISFSVLVNLVNFGLAVTAVVLYSVDLAQVPFSESCELSDDFYGYRYRYYETTTPSTQKQAEINEMVDICKDYMHLLQHLRGGVDIIMIVLSFLQICVTISACVLSLKALCKKEKGDEMDDSGKPLLVEEVLTSPAC